MNLPFEYDQVTLGEFAGVKPTTSDFDRARVVILPIPLDRTTSYVAGTRTGPHEILVASSHMELWDEETETDVHKIGIYTLPELELPFGTMEDVVREIRRVVSEIVKRGKFPVVLGGEHSITPPVVAAVAASALTSSGKATVASDWTDTLAESVASLPQLCASSRLEPEAPPKCGTSETICSA